MAKKKRLRVYIAGPYSSDDKKKRQENIDHAERVAMGLFKKGHTVYLPHKTTEHWDEKCPASYEDYFEFHSSWLPLCDALFYIGSSKGADRELEMAKKSKMIIFKSIEEVPNAKE